MRSRSDSTSRRLFVWYSETQGCNLLKLTPIAFIMLSALAMTSASLSARSQPSAMAHTLHRIDRELTVRKRSLERFKCFAWTVPLVWCFR